MGERSEPEEPRRADADGLVREFSAVAAAFFFVNLQPLFLFAAEGNGYRILPPYWYTPSAGEWLRVGLLIGALAFFVLRSRRWLTLALCLALHALWPPYPAVMVLEQIPRDPRGLYPFLVVTSPLVLALSRAWRNLSPNLAARRQAGGTLAMYALAFGFMLVTPSSARGDIAEVLRRIQDRCAAGAAVPATSSGPVRTPAEFRADPGFGPLGFVPRVLGATWEIVEDPDGYPSQTPRRILRRDDRADSLDEATVIRCSRPWERCTCHYFQRY